MHFYLKVINHKQNYTKNLKLFLASMGETKLFHDSFLKFLLGLFEVVEVKGYLRLNFETSPQGEKVPSKGGRTLFSAEETSPLKIWRKFALYPNFTAKKTPPLYILGHRQS